MPELFSGAQEIIPELGGHTHTPNIYYPKVMSQNPGEVRWIKIFHKAAMKVLAGAQIISSLGH